ncbi:MAG: nucleotidyl transferase AbiEii/AbiGii toxin family protein [Bacteriovoracaceae bacterium]|nr:nucleotidyl transferase AbiEii/AbiGii toxin family protein [Bacteriovoracaceae bacterium]
MDEKTFKQKFISWASKNEQHGAVAFQKFVMLTFLEAMGNISSDFIFKGGNLLWHYIKTPRQTIDLDFSTLHLKSHKEVRESLNKALNYFPNIKFSIKDFSEVEQEGEFGANVIIAYKTNSGQSN